MAELSFENPVFYINSGNLFFDSEEQKERIREILTACFSRSSDFPLPFVLVNSSILEKETANLLTWWQAAFFYSNVDLEDYLKSNYHKKLLKSSFYKQLIFRNGKTFQKIVELVNEK